MSHEMEELGRRTSVVVRVPSNEDHGYSEDDEYEDEYELDNLDTNHSIKTVPSRNLAPPKNIGRTRSKSRGSRNTEFNGYSMHNNNSTSNNTNMMINSEYGDVLDDDDDDDDDDDYFDDDDEDFDDDDERNTPLNYYKSVPRTLPQIDIFTQRYQKKDENDISGVNRPTDGYFRNRNHSQVSAFLLKAPLTQLNENKNGPLKPASILSKLPRPRKSDRLSSKDASSIGHLSDTDSYFPKSKIHNNHNNGSTISANIDNHQSIHRLVARPPVDNQDKLLGEMALLNDVKRKANEMGFYDAFPEGIEEKLRDLRQCHTKVIQLLREREAKAEEQKRRAIQANNNNALTAPTSNNTMYNSMSDVDIGTTDKITNIPSNFMADTRGMGATSTSITTSGNQIPKLIREMPAPGLMSNPDTSRYIETLVNNIKDL